MTKHKSFVALIVAAVIGGGAGAGIVLVATPNQTTKTITRVVSDAGTNTVAASSDSALTPREVYDKAKDSVAFITAQIQQQQQSPFGFQLPPQSSQATGTGFVISTDGYVVTNAHVVNGASSVKVKIGDGQSTSAKIVGKDESTDIALLKVDVGNQKLTPLTFGDSSAVKVGDPTYAIGNPFGLSRTLTTGVVSALQRQIQAPNGFSINDVIQTDAALNPGNSGGPLFDAHGNVIGVNSQIATGSGVGAASGNVGIGFAVPSNTVRQVVDQLKSTGKAEHAYLGVQTGDASGNGVRVESVTKNGPAQQGGIHRGDIITSIGGTSVKDPADLASAVDSHKPKDKVEVKFRRGNDTKTVQVILGNRPNNVTG